VKRTQYPAKATVLLRATNDLAAETALQVAVTIEPLLNTAVTVAVELPHQLTPYARSLGVRLASKRNHWNVGLPTVTTVSATDRDQSVTLSSGRRLTAVERSRFAPAFTPALPRPLSAAARAADRAASRRRLHLAHGQRLLAVTLADHDRAQKVAVETAMFGELEQVHVERATRETAPERYRTLIAGADLVIGDVDRHTVDLLTKHAVPSVLVPPTDLTEAHLDALRFEFAGAAKTIDTAAARSTSISAEARRLLDSPVALARMRPKLRESRVLFDGSAVGDQDAEALAGVEVPAPVGCETYRVVGGYVCCHVRTRNAVAVGLKHH
jgi:hypothetical protein